jgi:hypothetical protein
MAGGQKSGGQISGGEMSGGGNVLIPCVHYYIYFRKVPCLTGARTRDLQKHRYSPRMSLEASNHRKEIW